MIKAAGIHNGKPLLIIGLSDANALLLSAGHPITFDLVELGLSPMRVVIVGGRTEDDIKSDLSKHFSGI